MIVNLLTECCSDRTCEDCGGCGGVVHEFRADVCDECGCYCVGEICSRCEGATEFQELDELDVYELRDLELDASEVVFQWVDVKVERRAENEAPTAAEGERAS